MSPNLRNVVATAAPFFALGGSTYAAFELPNGSVGTDQLKNGAVSTKKIKNGAVTATKINLTGLTAPNAVHADSADNAVTATSATSASDATSATNAQALGGVPHPDITTRPVGPHRGERNDHLAVGRHLSHLPPLRLGRPLHRLRPAHDRQGDNRQPQRRRSCLRGRRSRRRAGAGRARSPALSTVRTTQTTSSSKPPTRRTPSAPIMPSTSPLHRDHPPGRNRPDRPPRMPMLVRRVQAPLHHPPVSHPFAARCRRAAPALEGTEHPDDEPCGPGFGRKPSISLVIAFAFRPAANRATAMATETSCVKLRWK